jgi:hypothetical protein
MPVGPGLRERLEALEGALSAEGAMELGPDEACVCDGASCGRNVTALSRCSGGLCGGLGISLPGAEAEAMPGGRGEAAPLLLPVLSAPAAAASRVPPGVRTGDGARDEGCRPRPRGRRRMGAGAGAVWWCGVWWCAKCEPRGGS